MKKLVFAVTLVVSQIAGASSLSDVLTKEAGLVYNALERKVDGENSIAFLMALNKCTEKRDRNSKKSCVEGIRNEVKKSFKKDMRALVPLVVTQAAMNLAGDVVPAVKHAQPVLTLPGSLIGMDMALKGTLLAVFAVMDASNSSAQH